MFTLSHPFLECFKCIQVNYLLHIKLFIFRLTHGIISLTPYTILKPSAANMHVRITCKHPTPSCFLYHSGGLSYRMHTSTILKHTIIVNITLRELYHEGFPLIFIHGTYRELQTESCTEYNASFLLAIPATCGGVQRAYSETRCEQTLADSYSNT